MTDLLPVETALERILNQIPDPTFETIDTTDALGRVLADDLTAPINLPPFANSSMDGFAVRSADLAPDQPTTLRVVMDIPAGTKPEHPLQAGEAARIMTGAPMPAGADAVVPVESTDAPWVSSDTLPEQVRIQKQVESGAYVREIGENIRTGAVVLQAGTQIRPQDIGMAIGLGVANLRVHRKPQVAILTTGDELVGVEDPLTPGKIRDTNSYTLAGLITTYGGIPIRLPVAHDTLDSVRARFQSAIDHTPDLIVSSAGVSVGTFDIVRTVLAEFGEVNFWRVNVRPGKPLAFGNVAGIPFFGLPGNPVSSMVTFDIFVRPVLLKLSGIPDDAQIQTAIAGEPMRSDGRRSYLRVKLHREDGRLIAMETGTQSSGALMSMVLADGLLIVPEDVKEVSEGTELPVRLLRTV